MDDLPVAKTWDSSSNKTYVSPNILAAFNSSIPSCQYRSKYVLYELLPIYH